MIDNQIPRNRTAWPYGAPLKLIHRINFGRSAHQCLNGNKLNATKALRDAGQQLIDSGGLALGKNLGKGVQVNVNGLNVTIRGENVGGKFRLGTAFIP